MAQASHPGKAASAQDGDTPALHHSLTRPFAAELPASLEPMIAVPAAQPFDSKSHIFEVAWDGLRVLVFVERDHVRVQDQYGHDVSRRYPEMQSIAQETNGSGLVFDGEIVMLDEEGVPSFERLLPRLKTDDTDDIATEAARSPVVFQCYDILYRQGRSVMNEPLRTRKRMLRQSVRRPGTLSVPDYVERDGVAFFEAAREHGLAGTVAKEADSAYVPGRGSRAWQVARVSNRGEFVVAGFTFGGTSRTNRSKSKDPFASLLLGAYDRWRQLHFVGEVTGGFLHCTPGELSDLLEKTTTAECPFVLEPNLPRLVFWCRPAVVASIAYSGWTADGRLLFPKFEWLRPDVPPEGCRLPDFVPA